MTEKIYSMTGFGSCQGRVGKFPVRVEIKSLNHRFLDLKLRAPRELSPIEMKLKSAIQSSLGRGSVEVKIESNLNEEDEGGFEFKKELAHSYLGQLKDFARNEGLDSVRVSDLSSFPDVVSKKSFFSKKQSSPEGMWEALSPLVEEAIHALQKMRAEEGEAIREVLREGVNALQDGIQKVVQRKETSREEIQRNLEKRIQKVWDDPDLPSPLKDSDFLESRVSQELVLLLDKLDIKEELSRFQEHLDQFQRNLDQGGRIGRKLEFILQELNREVNTLSNKAQDFKISHEVVNLKVGMEQLREQVLNLE